MQDFSGTLYLTAQWWLKVTKYRKLLSTQQTKNSLLAMSQNEAGKGRSKTWKFLILSIARSTWILREAIRQVVMSSGVES